MSDNAEGDDTALKLSLPPQSEDTAEDSIALLAASDNDTELSAMTVTELRVLAKSRGLTGYSTMNKNELIALLSEN
ncbi:MAG: Rho termination factor N-terminal domain-containing protein [Ruminococcus sp.]|nr:Rho termination factor N-terminal domain-containing protein [Ruminococcus sp.]